MPPKAVYPGDENVRAMIQAEIAESVRIAVNESVDAAVDRAFKRHRKSIKQELKQELKPITRSINSLRSKIETLSTFKEDVKKTVDFAHTRINDIYEHAIPAINAHIRTIASALSQRLLDLDVHRRKWSLNVQGIKGVAGEEETETRTKTVDFATSKLGIRADPNDYAACHRLSQTADSGIIMRFQDLSQRNAWLDNAKNLRHHPDCGKVSISPDLPNDLRPLKTELLNIRKALPREQKKNSSIRYLKQWPYVELRIKNQPTIRPTESITHVCERVLGLTKNTLLLNVAEPEREDEPHIRDIAFPLSASSDEEDGSDAGEADEATNGEESDIDQY